MNVIPSGRRDAYFVPVPGPAGPMGLRGFQGFPGDQGPPGFDALTQNPTFLNGGELARLGPTTVGIQPYSCADSTGTVWIRMPGPANLVKDTTGAWQAGNAGGMGIGVVQAPNTWYHLFAALTSGGVADAYIDTSVTGVNAPPGITARRRIGSILTNNAGDIFNFQQNDSLFTWCPLGTDTINIINQALGQGAPQATAFRALMVPPGLRTIALLTGNITILTSTGLQNFQAVFYPTFMGSFTPASFSGFISIEALGQGGIAAFDVQVMSDEMQNIGLGWAATASSTQININCRGYIDLRGQL